MVKLKSFALMCFGFASLVRGDSLASIDHVVLFMQENRAFDHVSFGWAN